MYSSIHRNDGVKIILNHVKKFKSVLTSWHGPTVLWQNIFLGICLKISLLVTLALCQHKISGNSPFWLKAGLICAQVLFKPTSPHLIKRCSSQFAQREKQYRRRQNVWLERGRSVWQRERGEETATWHQNPQQVCRVRWRRTSSSWTSRPVSGEQRQQPMFKLLCPVCFQKCPILLKGSIQKITPFRKNFHILCD